MNRLFKSVFVFLFVISYTSTAALMAQTTGSHRQFPVVFSKPDSLLPASMEIKGRIVDLTFTSADCGGIAFAGTLQIQLDERIVGYPYDNVYLVKLCFGDFEKAGRKRKEYIGKHIELTVYKAFEDYQFGKNKDVKNSACAWDVINNVIDSKGVAFYCTNADISLAIKNFNTR